MSKIVYADELDYVNIPSCWFKDEYKNWDLKSHYKDGRIIRSDNLMEGL